MSGTVMIPGIWGTARVIIDEERFAGLPEFEHTVEPRGLELLLYMVNGTTAVLHPVLQGQVGVGFVPALIAMCTVVYGLSLGCIVYRNPALFHRRGLRMIVFSIVLWALTTVKFDLTQTYILLPILIDVGGLLACQDSLSA